MRTVPFRFKTESELFDEFGPDWRRKSHMNTRGRMDYLLGTLINVPLDSLNKKGEVARAFRIRDINGGGGWFIGKSMLSTDTRPMKLKSVMDNIRKQEHNDRQASTTRR